MTALVVGGGLAGLVAGYRLAQAGRAVNVLESGPQLGGMIGRVELGGVTVDSGAEAYAVRGVVRELCDELGLEVQGPAGQPHVWWPDGSWPMAQGVLGIPASVEDPALGALSDDDAEQLAGDLTLGPEVGADAVSVGELVRARMGQGAVDKLVAPVAKGVYSLDPDRMPLAAFAPGLVSAVAEHGSLMAAVAAVRGPGAAAVEQPVGGMFRLIDALADAIVEHGGQIRRGATATGVKRLGAAFAVALTDGEMLEAEQLVLATPAAVTAALVERLGVTFAVPPVKTARLAMFSVRSAELAAGPVGSGLLVGEPDPSIHAKALTHYSVKWPWSRREDQEIIRLSYPDQFLPNRAEVVADASRFLGVDIDDDAITGFASVGWESLPGRLEASTHEYLLQGFAEAGIDVVGAWLDGNGIASVVAGCSRVLR